MSQLHTMVPNSCDAGEVTSDRDYALLDASVNVTPESLIVVSPEGMVLFWNRGTESIFDFTPSETRHQLPFDLTDPTDRLQEILDALQLSLRNSHASGESVRRRRVGSLIRSLSDFLTRTCSRPLS